jgi:hypothetical protein
MRLLSITLTLLISTGFAQDCKPLPQSTMGLFDQCQTSYYKYAPHCMIGEGSCLSLVLFGLINKNLFEYRDDLRRTYNTPLKRAEFAKTREYQKAMEEMMDDYHALPKQVFCSKTKPRWIYDMKAKAFTFPFQNPISNTSLSLYQCLEPTVHMSYKEAVKVEEWDSLAEAKYVFFSVLQDKGEGGRVKVQYSDFVWTLGEVEFSPEGDVEVSYKEACTLKNGSGLNSYRHQRHP